MRGRRYGRVGLCGLRAGDCASGEPCVGCPEAIPRSVLGTIGGGEGRSSPGGEHHGGVCPGSVRARGCRAPEEPGSPLALRPSRVRGWQRCLPSAFRFAGAPTLPFPLGDLRAEPDPSQTPALPAGSLQRAALPASFCLLIPAARPARGGREQACGTAAGGSALGRWGSFAGSGAVLSRATEPRDHGAWGRSRHHKPSRHRERPPQL